MVIPKKITWQTSAEHTLEKFTKKFHWPATLATLSGLSIVVRENTDLESPFAVEQFTIGYTMPILGYRLWLLYFSFYAI